MTVHHANLKPYAVLASKVYGVPVDQVTSAQRRIAKCVCFLALYGHSNSKQYIETLIEKGRPNDGRQTGFGTGN